MIRPQARVLISTLVCFLSFRYSLAYNSSVDTGVFAEHSEFEGRATFGKAQITLLVDYFTNS